MALTSSRQIRWALTGFLILLYVLGMVAEGLPHSFVSHPCDTALSVAQVHGHDNTTSVSGVDAECAKGSSSILDSGSDPVPENQALFHCACVCCALLSLEIAVLASTTSRNLCLVTDSRVYISHHPELIIPPIIASI